VCDKKACVTYPEVVIPISNAAYDGVKEADSSTQVIGFNMATTGGFSKHDWEEYNSRAFDLDPKFDLYGFQTHGMDPNVLGDAPDKYDPEVEAAYEECNRLLGVEYRRDSFFDSISLGYGGVQGVVNLRTMLDYFSQGRGKPLWQNESGFQYESKSPESQAEGLVQTYVILRTLDVNLKGWVHFALLGSVTPGVPSVGGKVSTDVDEESLFGIMSSWNDQVGSPQYRLAGLAYKNLFRKIRFFDYDFELNESSGAVNRMDPYVLKFQNVTDLSRKLWVIFSPRASDRRSVEQVVPVNVGTVGDYLAIDMIGNECHVSANSDEIINVLSTRTPIFIKSDSGVDAVVSTTPGTAVIKSTSKSSSFDKVVSPKESFSKESSLFRGSFGKGTSVKDISYPAISKEYGTKRLSVTSKDSAVVGKRLSTEKGIPTVGAVVPMEITRFAGRSCEEIFGGISPAVVDGKTSEMKIPTGDTEDGTTSTKEISTGKPVLTKEQYYEIENAAKTEKSYK